MATRYGTDSANTLTGTSSADTLWGRGGNDTLNGLAGNDLLHGEAGNDLLKGGLGGDLLDGGTGIDRATWYDDGGSAGITADLGTGEATRGGETDALVSIENATGTAYADTIHGDGGGNDLRGAGGNDTILGRDGDDRLYGESGDDEIYGGAGWNTIDGGDGDDHLDSWGGDGDFPGTSVIYGGAGNDRILSDSEYGSSAYGGAGDDIMTGGSFNDALFYGEAGNDRIDISSSEEVCLAEGGDGDDVLVGGSGESDLYLKGGAGKDTLTLESTGYEAVGEGDSEADLIDARPIDSAFRIELLGGDGDDTIYGGSLRDDSGSREGEGSFLYGQKGNDRISGNASADKIGGGAGVDRMTGGGGGDTFDINTGDSGIGLGRRDVITDFIRGSDRIDLLSIDANLGRAGDQAFSFVGTQPLTGAGQLRYGTSGTTTIIQGSNDADSAAEFELELAAATTLAATDFVL